MYFIDALASNVMSWLEKQRRAIVLKQTKGRLLDIGCGNNNLVQDYRKRGGAGIGVDVYNFGAADLVVPNTAELPFPNKSFDTITFVACLNHIPNRIDVLRTAHRLLSDDGRLLVTMIPPGLSRVWHRLIKKYDEDQTERGMKEGEVWGFTTDQIEQVLGVCSFSIIRHTRFVFGLNNLYAANKYR
jgi:SAM-dependent methyltransferase